jgi:hypothetical protein
MALPYYPAPLSISMIRNELGVSNSSLRQLSQIAGKYAPDYMSEFYGYSPGPTYTFYDYGYTFDPCEGSYQLYQGSDENWYRSFDGGATYILCTGDIYFGFGYYDLWIEQFVYFGYQLDFGLSLSYWGEIYSFCAPPWE